jgi:hypothetical protein
MLTVSYRLRQNRYFSALSGDAISMNAQSAPNTNGTALLQGCVILFVAQAFGLGLALSQQVVALLLAVLSAVAEAGVPDGLLALIASLLAIFALPKASASPETTITI